MRRLIFYFLLGASVAVFAQQQLSDTDEAEPRTEPPAGAGLDAANAIPDPRGDAESGVGQEASTQMPDEPEPVVSAEDPREIPPEAAPSDSDFKPEEEISEDFPVPLPSDI